jgi:hypothetical protein
MLFTQAAKLKPRFCSGDYGPFWRHQNSNFHVVLSLPNSMNGATSVSFKRRNGTCWIIVQRCLPYHLAKIVKVVTSTIRTRTTNA